MDQWGEMYRDRAEKAEAEIARLRALVAEAAEIMEGDGEYPKTAARLRAALEQKVGEER